MLLEPRRRVAIATALLALGCEARHFPDSNVDCTASQGANRILILPHETAHYLFVVDDSRALRPHEAAVKDALGLAVSRIVNTRVAHYENGEWTRARAQDPFAGNGYRNLTFSFLFAGSPDASDACARAHAAHGGGLLTSPEHPDGVFRWEPTTWPDLSNGAAALERLVLDVRSTLEQFPFSDCEESEPLEALFHLLAEPAVDATVLAQRAAVASSVLSVVFIAGSDDLSGPGTALYPEERYQELFDSSDDTGPPLYVQTTLIGPVVATDEDCLLWDLAPASAPSGEPRFRLERVVDTPAHFLCLPSFEDPDDQRFLYPLFDKSYAWRSAANPRCWAAPTATALDVDPASTVYGRAQCRVFEVMQAEEDCSCDRSHLAPLALEQLPNPIQRLIMPLDAACACEIEQLSGPALGACQSAPDVSVHDSPGWCLLHPALGAVHDDVTEGCWESPHGYFRFAGRDVPSAGSYAVSVCATEECAAAGP